MNKIERFCKNCISKSNMQCTLHERSIKTVFDSCKMFSAVQYPTETENKYRSLIVPVMSK